MKKPVARKSGAKTAAKTLASQPAKANAMQELAGSIVPLAGTIRALYGAVRHPENFIREHIAELQASDDPLAVRVGEVLAMAEFGFGIGAIVPLAIIAGGQLLLGHPLAAVGTLAGGATLAHPVVLTCAAVGALYAGWRSLSKEEQAALAERLGGLLAIGAELVKSIFAWLVSKLRSLFTPTQLRALAIQ